MTLKSKTTLIPFSLILVSFFAAPAPAQGLKPLSAICIEAESGMVLAEVEADIPRPPASMVKMILMLMISEGMEAGLWDVNTPIRVSPLAAAQGGTQVFLKTGETWPLNQMMNAVAVASANDAAVAVAEALWGSESQYLQAANVRMRELGMFNTTFYSANGLPPGPGENFDVTTARDMAMLARACVSHPRIMGWVGQRQVQFRPTDAIKENTNKLLWRMPNCDGLKTGFIRAAGFCIAATAERDGMRLISIVLGSPDKWGRFQYAQDLMDNGFGSVSRLRLIARGQEAGEPVPVKNCTTPAIRLTAAEDVWITVRKEDLPNLKVVAAHPETLRTPITKGAVVGEIRVNLAGSTLVRSPLTVPVDLEASSGALRLQGPNTTRTAAARTRTPTPSASSEAEPLEAPKRTRPAAEPTRGRRGT